ncbi:hypothetical protein KLP28_05980 [Nocardioidaceae bacterium]|nr:hypothetical protein KLP28_05980 [Nocardioidaceae bacterium]
MSSRVRLAASGPARTATTRRRGTTGAVRAAGLLVYVALSRLLAACGGAVTATASCSTAQPTLDIAATSISPGERVRVTGMYFTEGCPDGRPSTDVRLVVHQRGEAYALGTTDARPDGTTVWTVAVPSALVEGRGVLRADLSQELRVRVTAED